MAVAGKVGAVFIQTSDAPQSFTKKLLLPDAGYTRYSISDRDFRYWDKASPVSVYVNDAEVFSGFSLEHCGGVVAFSSPLEAEDTVAVSGKSVQITQCGGFFNWSMELKADTADTTTFTDGGWKGNLPVLKGFSGSADSYWGDSEFFRRLGQEMIIALYVDSTSSVKRYEGYGSFSADSIEVPVEDIVKETLEFQGNDRIYYRED